MRARGRAPSRRRVLPAALVALALAPAAALGDGTPALPRPGVRLVVAADAIASNVKEPPGLAAGGRVSAGVQFPRLRFFGVLEAELPLRERWSERTHLGTLVLGGPGVGYLRGDRTLLHAAVLGGGEWVSRRDYLNDGWVTFGSAAGGARVGLSFRPVAPGERMRIGPTVGVAFTALFVERGTDPLTGARWGGWTPMVTVSVGPELRRSHVEPPAAGRNSETP